LTKQDHITYWLKGSDESWQGAILLLEGKQFTLAAFCFHLTIEKLLKANWVKNNEENYPPRIHNLTYLHNEAKLNLDDEMKDLCKLINSWNQEGRYPEYISKLHQGISGEYLSFVMNDLIKLRQCLQSQLQ
jgi:HEPN domain-containing protein